MKRLSEIFTWIKVIYILSLCRGLRRYIWLCAIQGLTRDYGKGRVFDLSFRQSR